MELGEAVRRRRMVREYDPDRPVDPAAVDRLLAAAARAPSAGHTQGWAFLVLDDRADVDRFWTATTPPERLAAPDRWLTGMRAAPVVVVPMSDPETYRARYAEADKRRVGDDPEAHWGVPYWHVDAGMATMTALLVAVEEGLGACFFNVPAARVPALRDAFGVPGRWLPVGAVTLGYPAPGGGGPGGTVRGSGRRRPRRRLDELVHRGRW